MIYKCLHYKTCQTYVKFIDGKGWVHLPSEQRQWMEHAKLSKKRLHDYNYRMPHQRTAGCGWKGAQPFDGEWTIKVDVCPGCGAAGELWDHHIASPKYPKRKGRKPRNGYISKRAIRGMRHAAFGACNARCHFAASKDCNCVCGGANHGSAQATRLL